MQKANTNKVKAVRLYADSLTIEERAIMRTALSPDFELYRMAMLLSRRQKHCLL